jgi:hypothetical protein
VATAPTGPPPATITRSWVRFTQGDSKLHEG